MYLLVLAYTSDRFQDRFQEVSNFRRFLVSYRISAADWTEQHDLTLEVLPSLLGMSTSIYFLIIALKEIKSAFQRVFTR